MKPEPLKNKEIYKIEVPEPLKGKMTAGAECSIWKKSKDIKSAVEWLLSKRVFKKCKGTLVNTELDEMYVFKKEDFEKAFEDIIK